MNHAVTAKSTCCILPEIKSFIMLFDITNVTMTIITYTAGWTGTKWGDRNLPWIGSERIRAKHYTIKSRFIYIIRMWLAVKAAICGCVKRYTSRVSPYMAESHAFSSNFDSAARWEHRHSRIPCFVMISLLFTTCISKHRISGTYTHCKMYME